MVSCLTSWYDYSAQVKLSFMKLSAVQCCGLKGLCINHLGWHIGFCVSTSNVGNTGEISGTSIRTSPEPAQVVSDCFLKHLLMSLNHHLEVKQIHCIAHQNTLYSQRSIPEAHNPLPPSPAPLMLLKTAAVGKAYPYTDLKKKDMKVIFLYLSEGRQI